MNKVTLGHFETTEDINRRVLSVLDSGRLSYGPVSREFESEFAKIADCDYAIASNSGTSALVVALQALKEEDLWQDGDEVIVPALTFVATINAILHCRLKPVLVDIELSTFNIDQNLIEDAITPRTRAILPVHLFGHPAPMDTILSIAEKHNLRVVEDCCEAFGASYRGSPVGSLGDIGCFSTYVGHHIVTGVGGMCTTSYTNISLRMRSLVNHGLDIWQLPQGADYEPTHLGRIFRFTSIGHSFRVTEIESAIGLAQLSGWKQKIEKRRENAAYLTELLSGCKMIQTPIERESCYHSYMMYPILSRIDTEEVMPFLQKRGIECRQSMPLTNQPCYNFDSFLYPRASTVNHYGYYVGCHEYLDESHMQYIASSILEFYG